MSNQLINESNSAKKEMNNKSLPKHLTLVDLLSIGVGGTIGSGVFVLCGVIANEYSGPSSCISWLIGGLAAFCSGCCYAELSCSLPQSGSSYVYVYHSMGELVAFLVAACLSLEYVVAGAAISRSWGDKVYTIFKVSIPKYWNGASCLISMFCTVILYLGIEESKAVTNIFSFVKLILVLFMCIAGLCLFQKKNMTPFFPMGVSGTLRGGTSSFFGYLGFDEVCCLTGEAINPDQNMPKAILMTILIVTILYFFFQFGIGWNATFWGHCKFSGSLSIQWI